MIKPSNFKSLLNNKIKKGKLISEIDIFLTEQGTLKDFIAKGTIKDLNAELFSGLSLNKVNFGFFADKNDVLIKNILGNLEDIQISNGNLKLNLESGIKLDTNFDSKLELDKNNIINYKKFFKKYKFVNNIIDLKASLNNNLSINLDNTYKVRDYNYAVSGKIKKSNFKLSNPFKNNFITEEIKEVHFSNFELNGTFDPIKTNLKGNGNYSFDNLDFSKIKLETILRDDLVNLKLDFDYKDIFQLDLINYKKTKNNIANISLFLEKKKNNLNIKNLEFKEGKNGIKIEDLYFKNNKFFSFKRIDVQTKNNDFFIKGGKKSL